MTRIEAMSAQQPGNVDNTHVRFAASSGSLAGRLWRPAKAGIFPGILFITSPTGLTSEMKRIAREIVSKDYVVLAPYLAELESAAFLRTRFRQRNGAWGPRVKGLLRELKQGHGRSVDDLHMARLYLASQPFVEAGSLGLTGFGMGGGFALLIAKSDRFQAAISFYGPAPNDLEGTCPIMASYGSRDRLMTPQGENLQRELTRRGAVNDVKVYPNAGYGFMARPSSALRWLLPRLPPLHAGFDPVAAADATERMFVFMATHLKRSP